MNIDKVVVGPLEENCYILSIDNECLVIDPGDEFNKIVNKIGSKKLLGVLITHHHFDHVGALRELLEKYNVECHDFNNLKEGEFRINNFKFNVIHNPGHTNDSISFYFKEDNCMFVGDFVFLESIGRCDLGGNLEDMKNSISRLKEIKNDITIYPGHGEKTTLNYEKKYNPFF